jgi:hypothetical protein
MTDSSTPKLCESSLEKLIGYCRKERWAGYDPYDGLNSPLTGALALGSKTARTAVIQLFKRSPINLRPIVGIKKEINPKGVALGARATVLLARHFEEEIPPQMPAPRDPSSAAKLNEGHVDDFAFLINALALARSRDVGEWCWGYNFDWQSRAFFAPRGTPNVVCTVFAAHAFLDWHEATGSEEALRVAASSCRFLLDRLNRSKGGEGFCFSYTPIDRAEVHNVNLLAAELLARTHSVAREDEFKDVATEALRWTLSRQRPDGSWPYGEAKSQRWIDGFHTGYVLVSLLRLMDCLRKPELKSSLEKGFEFYRKNFFLGDYTPKYYHDRIYPIDVHSSAQSIITFTEMAKLFPECYRMAESCVRWAIENLQHPSGYFYFQKHRLYTNKIAYLRWSQTWMLYALSLFLIDTPGTARRKRA